MEIEAIKGKEYLTSAGERAVHTGRVDADGYHVLRVGMCRDYFTICGREFHGDGPSIIDEWPETTDAPEGHVNTAEIVVSKPVTQDEWNDWIVLDDHEHDASVSEWICLPDGKYYIRTRKAPVMTTVTLYGEYGKHGLGWNFGDGGKPGDHDTHEITMVMKDGVPQSIANVEVIK